MTAVIAIRNPETNEIWVGSDSCYSYMDLRLNVSNNHRKAFKFFDEVGRPHILGCAGMLRDLNLIQTNDYFKNMVDDEGNILPLFTETAEYDMNFVVRYLVPRILHDLNENGRMRQDSNLSSSETSFLYANDKYLFVIGENGDVIQSDFLAIGASNQFISGAWEMFKELNPTITDYKETILNLLQITAKNTLYVNSPFFMLKNDKSDAEV